MHRQKKTQTKNEFFIREFKFRLNGTGNYYERNYIKNKCSESGQTLPDHF